MSLALEFEAKVSHSNGGRNGGSEHVLQNVGKSPIATNNRQQTIGISEAEKQARYARGECFRCGERFGPGHRCKTGTLRILEVEDVQEHTNCTEPEHTVADDNDPAEISLHALVGTPNHSTLIVPGYINSSPVSVLIDCGSTHNFIHDVLISKLGLATHEVGSFGVRIGNGDIISCNRVCKKVEIWLADLKIMQDLYPFALGGADIVLGIEWLASLNTVRANWKKMFLKFTLNGKDYELQGKRSGYQPAATFRHFTIESNGQPSIKPTSQLATTGLEGKPVLRAGSIDTTRLAVANRSNCNQEHGEGK